MTAQRPSGRLRLHWLWVLLGGVLMVWSLYLALQPNPGLHLDFPNGDKLLHALGFACLMVWWGNVFAAPRARRIAVLGCLAYGVLVEVLQWFDPPRSADVFDVLADIAGIVIALALLRTPLAGVLAWVERGLLGLWRAG